MHKEAAYTYTLQTQFATTVLSSLGKLKLIGVAATCAPCYNYWFPNMAKMSRASTFHLWGKVQRFHELEIVLGSVAVDPQNNYGDHSKKR